MKKLIPSHLAPVASLVFLWFAIAAGAQDSGAGKKPKLVVKSSLAEKLIGYWAPSKEAMLKIVQEQLPEEAKTDEAAIAAMRATLDELLGTVVMEFQKEKAIMHSPGGQEIASYKIKSTNRALGEIVVEVTHKAGKPEEGKAIIKGNQLTLTMSQGQGTEKMVLDRITEAEFKKRLGLLKKFDGEPADAADSGK